MDEGGGVGNTVPLLATLLNYTRAQLTKLSKKLYVLFHFKVFNPTAFVISRIGGTGTYRV